MMSTEYTVNDTFVIIHEEFDKLNLDDTRISYYLRAKYPLSLHQMFKDLYGDSIKDLVYNNNPLL